MHDGAMYSRKATKMRIVRLLMQETGTYNDMYSRPYVSYMDGGSLNALGERMAQYGQGRVTGDLLAGVTTNLVAPSATPDGIVPVEHGWKERRVRFLMEVYCEFSIGSAVTYYIQGYTSHAGISASGAVDPTMVFYVNSFTGVNRVMTHTPTGMQLVESVVESAHVLANSNYSGVNDPNKKLMIRPQDVFSSIQTMDMTDAYDGMGYGYGGGMDLRSVLRNEPARSSRENALPSSYVARVIDGYQVGKMSAEFGQSENDIIQSARRQVFEEPIGQNPFIRAISDIYGTGMTNAFRMPDLHRIDPNVDHVTTISILGQTNLAKVHHAGSTEYWGGSNRETVVATVLANAVPALMMDTMIQNIKFMSTNHSVDGRPSTTIIQAQSLTNADLRRQYDTFMRRLEREVIHDFTYGNQERYMIEMQVDLFGESFIRISIGDSPMTDFVTPSFCDTLLVPVISGNQAYHSNLINDFSNILSVVSEATHGVAPMNLNPNV